MHQETRTPIFEEDARFGPTTLSKTVSRDVEGFDRFIRKPASNQADYNDDDDAGVNMSMISEREQRQNQLPSTTHQGPTMP